jgi:hypothetical protein
MRLKAKTTEELTDRFGPNTSREPEGIARGHHQAREPTAPCLGFPKPRLRMAISPLHGLLETRPTAFGKPRLLGKTSNTLRAVVTKTVDDPQAFVPKSHVGLFSEG